MSPPPVPHRVPKVPRARHHRPRSYRGIGHVAPLGLNACTMCDLWIAYDVDFIYAHSPEEAVETAKGAAATYDPVCRVEHRSFIARRFPARRTS